MDSQGLFSVWGGRLANWNRAPLLVAQLLGGVSESVYRLNGVGAARWQVTPRPSARFWG